MIWSLLAPAAIIGQTNDTHSASSDPASAAIPAGTYAVDTERSMVTFRAKAFGLMWVRGRIPVREGSITISEGRITGTGLLAADRIDTALGPRDWHLRSAHYLHTDKHPTIRVAIDGAYLSSQSVPCEVTVRETTAPTQLRLRSIEAVDTLHITAETTVDRTVYPMLGPWVGVSRRANLLITLVARPTRSG
ncbi:YceI family protein [Rhodococcus sp. NPDC056960]|uniref:YceI family protein n=1 Tax=Rhodococcus TaxID=1827 RepID=UPI0036327724